MATTVIPLHRPKFCRHGSKLVAGGAACTCDPWPPRCGRCGHALSHGACPQCEPTAWALAVEPQPGDPQLVSPCERCGGQCDEPDDPALPCKACDGRGGIWS